MTARILLRDIYHLVIGDAAHTRERGVDLLVVDGRVADIGRGLPAGDAEVIDCSTKLVMPGLVNSHHHMCQTLQRNIRAVQSAELFDWLVGLYPIWAHIDEAVVRVSTTLACAELLLTGCTTTSDHHYVHPRGVSVDLIETQLRAAEAIGMRFLATRGSMSVGKSGGGLPPDSVVQDDDTILAASERLIKRHHDDDPFALRRVALAPCSPFSISSALMKRTAELTRAHGVRLHTHLAETRDEERYCLEHYGCRPLELMARVDWLGDDVWYAHGIFFDDDELARMADTGTGVAHCPSSNMRLGSGFCRVHEMRERGVPVGLAVDGSASNDASNMIGELRSCLLLNRVRRCAQHEHHAVAAGAAGSDDNTLPMIDPDTVLELATRGSARLLGWDTVGSLEKGKAADIAIVEMNRLDYAGATNDPLAAIMFCGASQRVDTTIVGGRIVVRGGKLLTVDEQALIDEANALSKAMLEAEQHDVSWNL